MKRGPRLSGKQSSAIAGAPAALGFRAHSGWAALVAVGGPAKSPSIIDRRRIELADPALPRPVQPYHMAREMHLEEAEEYLKRFEHDSVRMAEQALRDEFERLHEAGFRVMHCAVPAGSGRLPATLAAILASHSALHTAEGELFRNALVAGGEKLGLAVLRMRERDLLEQGATQLKISVKDLERRLREFGRSVGPPWGQDQKLAALAAWLALAGLEGKGQ